MKIENFELRMQSKYTHETTILSPFEHELQSIETDYQEAAEYEKKFLSKINFMLIQEFLQILQPDSTKTDSNMDMRGKLKSLNGIKPKISTLQTHDIQKLDVSMQGFIQTKNKKISININVAMSQEIYQSKNVEIPSFADPLVINLDADMPQLSSNTFSFDIDNDGTSDQISKLKKGNGFLALDRDYNGTIDAGNELFGSQQGNGFEELSLFDSDKNFWIDENDSIFDKLRVWVNNDDKNELLALGEVGIGAIYLGNTDTSFEYKDEKSDLGKLKSSGLFLRENGEVGIISQLDLAKQEEPPKIPLDSPLVSLLNA